MKKIIAIAAVCFFALQSFTFAPVPTEKVLEAFSKTFEKAEDVKWTTMDDSYEASFKQNDISCRVLFDSDGNITKSIRYYGGKNLPIFIQSKLQKKFADKTVFGVTELSGNDQLTYHIVLENATEFYHVQSDSYGNITIDKKFKKAL